MHSADLFLVTDSEYKHDSTGHLEWVMYHSKYFQTQYDFQFLLIQLDSER